MVENVGWEAGNKKATPIYKRNNVDGSFIIDDEGDFIIDSDFSSILNKVRNSDAANYFDWINPPTTIASTKSGEKAWCVNISEVINDSDLTMDPKRYCKRHSLCVNLSKVNLMYS